MQITIKGFAMELYPLWVNAREKRAVAQVSRPEGPGWERLYSTNPAHEIAKWDKLRANGERRKAKRARRNCRVPKLHGHGRTFARELSSLVNNLCRR